MTKSEKPTAPRAPTAVERREFARRLQQTLLDRQMTQSDLARAMWGERVAKDGNTVARNRDLISKYINGKSVPERRTLNLMSEVLNVEADWLFPSIMGTGAEREAPEIEMRVLAGGRALLRINALLPLAIAMSVQQQVAEALYG